MIDGLICNQLQRHQFLPKLKFQVNQATENSVKFTEYINDENFRSKLDFANSNPDSTEAREIVANLMPFIKQVGINIPHSIMKKQQTISEMYAMFQFLGLPTWFFTLAPLSNDDLLTIRLAKATFDDPMSEHCMPDKDPSLENPQNNNEFNIKVHIPGYFERLKTITNDPMASSKMFMRIVRAVFVILLGIQCNFDDLKKAEYIDVDLQDLRNDSVVGRVYGHFGVFETNGRKVLHFHSLLFGIFNPTFMSNVLDDETTSKLVTAILDSMVSCELDKDIHTSYLYRAKNRMEAPRFPNVSVENSDEIKSFKVMYYLNFTWNIC
jgi:hypothetical protein